ncbi:MAG TPA: class I SAM-dependent methyltransferase [Pyrinomonadaceae bacterium]|nr:class I SAM-dependent methyltransferase [Pyrinomonadaceae bacterium]
MKPEPLKGPADASTLKAPSDVIREFYTNHPYPPPLANLDRAISLWQDPNVHRAEFHLLWPHKEYRADFDVLVAGCGTWQAARFALTHPAARVTAIDIAATSLQHTEALKQKYDMKNLETRQLALEDVGELDQQFDFIISTGVLHHLVDPDAGLRVLRSALRPEGAMYLMLYAPYGRTGISMFQEYCRTLGIDTSPQELRDLTETLRLLPQPHPLVLMFRGSKNALDAGALIDALLNPRDRTYSVPQLYDFLERNEMSFGRWYWQAPYSVCGDVAKTPHAARLAALPERDRFKAVELWRGLISNHDFIAYRNDAPNHGSQVRFDDDRYLNYVPVRRAWTMCVQDGVPPDAAGLLVNQTHMFPDIRVEVDALEKQIYEAIDGQRTIGAIVESAPDSSSRARDFFEKLWYYDQAVFDTSRTQ